VLSTAGDTYLGGDDFDDRIMNWLADDFLARHKLDLRQNKFCLQMLKEAAEKAKIDVGGAGVATVHCAGICQDVNGNVIDLTQTLTQDAFNRMVMDLVQRTFKVCDEALQSARMTAADVDAVILVGGPTRLPIIANSVRHYFSKEVMAGVDPDQVVSLGAALQAHALVGQRTDPHREVEDLHHQPRRPGQGEDPRLPGGIEPRRGVRAAGRVRVRRLPHRLPR
jgi:molecular chaperone DnaK